MAAMKKELKIIISGGGSGGHIFPAIAIAEAIKEKHPNADILFVGAKGKMEMEKIPEAGYEIIGLWISGFRRSFSFDNLSFPLKVISSLLKSRSILKSFKPDLVFGVGGFASGPLVQAAAWRGCKTLIQEQNSYPGITNKILSKSVDKICVAYDEMHRFFPKDKMIKTGNPIRQAITNPLPDRAEALSYFGLEEGKPVLFVTGGSLGARGINEAVANCLDEIEEMGLQVLWQSGKLYHEWAEELLKNRGGNCAKLLPFVKRMDMAYSAADILLSRAGAMSIAEQQVIGKAVILQPSPNVAEDHQTHNAMALVKKNAAFMITDKEAKTKLAEKLRELVQNPQVRKELGISLKQMEMTNASEQIVAAGLALIEEDRN